MNLDLPAASSVSDEVADVARLALQDQDAPLAAGDDVGRRRLFCGRSPGGLPSWRTPSRVLVPLRLKLRLVGVRPLLVGQRPVERERVQAVFQHHFARLADRRDFALGDLFEGELADDVMGL